jgi:hypothetical protein
VVPTASSLTSPDVMSAAVRPRPATAMYISRMRMTTTLLMTGVHIGAANRPRALRIAPASELTP